MRNIKQNLKFLFVILSVFSILIFAIYILFHSIESYIVPNTEELRKDVVVVVSQILVGISVLIGSYFAWQRIEVSKEEQITERFTRAIEQLGSNRIEISMGGIYALGRIANDSKKDMPIIIDVLATFIRNKSDKDNINGRISDDIQAALNVIKKLSRDDGNYINLSGSFLKRADLSKADIKRFDFSDTNLEGVDLSFSYIKDSYFTSANMEGAKLYASNFYNIDLTGANLRGSDLMDATFLKSYLTRANLTNSYLKGLSLKEVDLTDTGLENTDIHKVNTSKVTGLKFNTNYKAK